MKIKWLIQDVGMRISQLYRKHDALEHMNEEMHPIGVLKDYPFITGLKEALGDASMP